MNFAKAQVEPLLQEKIPACSTELEGRVLRFGHLGNELCLTKTKHLLFSLLRQFIPVNMSKAE